MYVFFFGYIVDIFSSKGVTALHTEWYFLFGFPPVFNQLSKVSPFRTTLHHSACRWLGGLITAEGRC